MQLLQVHYYYYYYYCYYYTVLSTILDALDVAYCVCTVQPTRDLFAIAKFLFNNV